MDRHARILSAVLVALIPGQLESQAPLLRFNASAGQATDLRGVRSAALTVAPSLTLFPSDGAGLVLFGQGTRFGEGVWSAGVGSSLDLRAPRSGAIGFTLQSAAHLTYASWHATYLQADALPAVELRAGPLAVYGGAKGALARYSETSTPRIGPFPGPSTRISETRDALGPAFGAALRVAAFSPGEVLRLRYREERISPLGVRVIDRTLSAELARGRVVLVGLLGDRDAADEARTFGGGRAFFAVARGLAVFGSAESYPANRLTGTAAGRSFAVGISLSTGGARTQQAMPRPRGVPAPPAGFTRLAIRAPAARTVEVAGDWNSWKPVPLAPTANGVWYVDLRIDPGEYRYGFRIDGSVWTVPEGVPAVDDGFGGRSAWLFVKESPASDTKPARNKEDG